MRAPARDAANSVGTSELADVAREHVHHLFGNFRDLDREHPGAFPMVIARGDGQYLYDSSGRRRLDVAQHLGGCYPPPVVSTDGIRDAYALLREVRSGVLREVRG